MQKLTENLRIEYQNKYESAFYLLKEFVSKDIKTIQETYNQKMLSFLFNDQSLDIGKLCLKIQEIRKKGGQGSGGVCGKVLTANDIGFKCLDCEKDSTCIICKECFENGDHSTHRYQIQSHCAGCCDCGDPEAWEVEGFCKKHKGFEIHTMEEIEKALGREFIHRYEEFFSGIIYYFIQITENMILDSQLKDHANPNFEVGQIYQCLWENILQSIVVLSDKTPMLQQLIQRVLSQKADMPLYHYCNNNSDYKVDEQQKQCSCTYLSLILRYNLLTSKNLQTKLEDFLISLFTIYEFKQLFIVTYTKDFKFLIKQIDGKLQNKSKIIDLEVQVFTSEELASYLLNNYQFGIIINECQNLMIEIIKNRTQDIQYTWYYFFKHITAITDKSQPLEILLTKNDLIQGILDIVYILHLCPVYDEQNKKLEKNSEFSLEIFELERQILIQITKIIQFAVHKKIDLTFMLLMILDLIEKSKNKFHKDKQYANIPLVRILAILLNSMINFDDSPDLINQQIQELATKLNYTPQEFHSKISFAILQTLSVQGFIRSLKLGKIHLHSQKVIEVHFDHLLTSLPKLYQKASYPQQSLDIYFLQIGTLILVLIFIINNNQGIKKQQSLLQGICGCIFFQFRCRFQILIQYQQIYLIH